MVLTIRDTTPPADPESLRAISREIGAACAGFHLRRAARAVTHHFDHVLAPVSLRTTQFTLLCVLAAAGSVTMNRLARIMVIDRTTLTRNLRVLREAGLVTSRSDRASRERQFQLTADGRAALARAIPLWQSGQARIDEAFGAERWRLLVGELGRLVDGLLAEAEPETPSGPAHECACPDGEAARPADAHLAERAG